MVEALGGLRGGFFLDSGASDGVSGSNTLLLEKSFGWRGICVEPNDQLFARLARARRSTCVHCCLYDRAGEVQFFEAAGVLGGILDEYDPNLLFQARSLVASQGGDGRSDPVTKPARTIGSILRQLHAPRTIDYWSLDTEGSELAILKSFPFSEYVVRLLTVEHNLSPSREPIRRFLESRLPPDEGARHRRRLPARGPRTIRRLAEQGMVAQPLSAAVVPNRSEEPVRQPRVDERAPST